MLPAAALGIAHLSCAAKKLSRQGLDPGWPAFCLRIGSERLVSHPDSRLLAHATLYLRQLPDSKLIRTRQLKVAIANRDYS